MVSNYKLLVFVFLLSVLPKSGTAEEIEKYTVLEDGGTYGFMLGLGVSLKYVSFDVYRSGETTPEGTLSEEENITYFLLAGSPYQYFGRGNLGYYLEMGISPFSFNQQEVGLNNQDLGTSVDGRYFYLTPVFFLNFGDKYFVKNYSAKLGFGIGVGYLRASGDIIFTENGQNTRFTYNINEWGIAYSLMLDARYKQWIFRLTFGGPEVTEGDYEYNVFEGSFDVGYTFYF